MREYVRGFADLNFGQDCDLDQVTNERCLATDIVSILDETKGEWFLDQRHGTSTKLQIHQPNTAVLKAQIQSQLVTEVSDQENRVTFGAMSIQTGAENPEKVPFEDRADKDSFLFLLIPFKVKLTNEEKLITLALTEEV